MRISRLALLVPVVLAAQTPKVSGITIAEIDAHLDAEFRALRPSP